MTTATQQLPTDYFSDLQVRRDSLDSIITDDEQVNLLSKDGSIAWNFHFWTHATGRCVTITKYTKKETIDHDYTVYPNTMWDSGLMFMWKGVHSGATGTYKLDRAKDVWDTVTEEHGATISKTIHETFGSHVPELDRRLMRLVNGKIVCFSMPRHSKHDGWVRNAYTFKSNEYAELWTLQGNTQTVDDLSRIKDGMWFKPIEEVIG